MCVGFMCVCVGFMCVCVGFMGVCVWGGGGLARFKFKCGLKFKRGLKHLSAV